jgi:hypothetical protein
MIMLAFLASFFQKSQIKRTAHDPGAASTSAVSAPLNPPGGVMGSQTDRTKSPDTAQRDQTPAEQKQVTFLGNRTFATSLLEEALRTSNPDHPIAPQTTPAGKIITLYRAYGFLRALVTEEADPTNPNSIRIRIEEGKRYTWGKVTATCRTLPAETVAALLPIEPGHPANLVDLKNHLQAFANYFTEQGYLDFSYTPDQSFDEANGQVNLKIEMHEGPQYVVREISLDSPKAQELCSKLKGQIFHPAEFYSILAQAGLSPNDVRLELDQSHGEIAIFSARRNP